MPPLLAQDLHLCDGAGQQCRPHRRLGVAADAVIRRHGLARVRVWHSDARAAPTATFYNPSASGSQTRNLDAGADCINTSADNASEDRLKVYTELPGGSGSTNLLSVHFTLSARL